MINLKFRYLTWEMLISDLFKINSIMQKLLFLILSILISFNSYGAFEKSTCALQNIDGIFYLQGMTKPYTGKYLCKYEKGQNKTIGQLKDGKRNGKWTSWYENGQIFKEGIYQDGKPDEKVTWWHENGQKYFERNYKDSRWNGKWTSWYESGQKERVENWKEDIPHGKWTTWYHNDQKKRVENWKYGKYDGTINEWYENGQKKRQLNYTKGKLIGRLKYWYANGQIMEIANYKFDKLDGKITRWYKNGQISEEENWKDDSPDGKWISWDENGQIKKEINYKKDKANDVSIASIRKITGPEEYGSVFNVGELGSWDEKVVVSSSIHFDDKIYRMWYSAYDLPWPGRGGIGLATSIDGINWNRVNNGNPVLSKGAPGSFDRGQITGPEVLYDSNDSLFKMWYGGKDAEGKHPYKERIGMATSPDGINWTRANNGNPVLDVGAIGDFNEIQITQPSVLKESDGFRMWYSAYSMKHQHTIGMAHSKDGIHWILDNNGLPILGLSPSFAVGPSVIKVDNRYVMIYTGYSSNRKDYRLYAATSFDGLNWRMLNGGLPLLIPSDIEDFDTENAHHPSIWFKDGVLKVWYGGERKMPAFPRIGLAELNLSRIE